MPGHCRVVEIAPVAVWKTALRMVIRFVLPNTNQHADAPHWYRNLSVCPPDCRSHSV